MSDSTIMTMPEGCGENPPGQRLPMGPLVGAIFTALDEAGVSWAVLRNAEGLPEYTRYDIDILIEARHLEQAIAIIESAAREHEWSPVGRIRKRHYTCLAYVSPKDPDTDERQFLPIDLFTGLEYRGTTFVNIARAMELRRKTLKGVWVMPAGFSAACTLMKELLPHSMVKKNSRKSIRAEVRADPEGFEKSLRPIIGDKLAKKVLESALAANWDDISRMSHSVQSAAIRRGPVRWWRLLDFAWKNLWYHLTKTGASALVVFLGPDGCGKTTIAEGVAERMYKRPFKVCRYMHGKFDIIPELKQLKVAAGKATGREFELRHKGEPGTKHAGLMKPHPWWRSMIYVAYYSLDLLLGRLKLRRYRAQWSLVLFDRYFYDYYYQLGNRNVPHWFLNILKVCAPKPDVVIYLERDPEEMYAAKPELSIEEIEREQKVLRDLVENRLRNAHKVDANVGVDGTIDAVCVLVEQALGLP